MHNLPPSGSGQDEGRECLGGLLIRRSRWTLSGKAKALVAAGLLGAGVMAFIEVQPFLAVTAASRSDVLVVEGWVPAFALRQAIVEFHAGGYREVITCGCLTHEDSGERIGSTYADWGAQRLARYGLNGVTITAVPCYVERRDRTYSSAVAVMQWLARNRPEATAIDVLTLGAHARRSRLLFQKAFGGKYRVGIVSVPNVEYDPNRWWQSSEGVREVLGEAVAYVYVRFFFWPGSREPEPTHA